MKHEKLNNPQAANSDLGAVSVSFNDKGINDAARKKYFRRYSGYIDEQIELDRSRDMQIDAFKEGAKWALKNCH